MQVPPSSGCWCLPVQGWKGMRIPPGSRCSRFRAQDPPGSGPVRGCRSLAVRPRARFVLQPGPGPRSRLRRASRDRGFYQRGGRCQRALGRAGSESPPPVPPPCPGRGLRWGPELQPPPCRAAVPSGQEPLGLPFSPLLVLSLTSLPSKPSSALHPLERLVSARAELRLKSHGIVVIVKLLSLMYFVYILRSFPVAVGFPQRALRFASVMNKANV